MANKRELKKEIRKVCGDIAAECLLAKYLIKGADGKALNAVINDVADLQISAVDNVTFSFDKLPHDFENRAEYNKARHTYFAKAYASLRTKFYGKVNEIVRNMNAAIPQEARDSVKKA